MPNIGGVEGGEPVFFGDTGQVKPIASGLPSIGDTVEDAKKQSINAYFGVPVIPVPIYSSTEQLRTIVDNITQSDDESIKNSILRKFQENIEVIAQQSRNDARDREQITVFVRREEIDRTVQALEGKNDALINVLPMVVGYINIRSPDLDRLEKNQEVVKEQVRDNITINLYMDIREFLPPKIRDELGALMVAMGAMINNLAVFPYIHFYKTESTEKDDITIQQKNAARSFAAGAIGVANSDMLKELAAAIIDNYLRHTESHLTEQQRTSKVNEMLKNILPSLQLTILLPALAAMIRTGGASNDAEFLAEMREGLRAAFEGDLTSKDVDIKSQLFKEIATVVRQIGPDGEVMLAKMINFTVQTSNLQLLFDPVTTLSVLLLDDQTRSNVNLNQERFKD